MLVVSLVSFSVVLRWVCIFLLLVSFDVALCYRGLSPLSAYFVYIILFLFVLYMQFVKRH